MSINTSLHGIELEDIASQCLSEHELNQRGVDANFFVLSSESGQNELRAYCNELGIAENSHIVGPVPHDYVVPFYDLIDVFVVSRPDTRVTRLVTPLKPFEAMRSGRAVVMADLPALAEIVVDGKTGRLYAPGDVELLSNTVQELFEGKYLTTEIGNEGARWIVTERTWDKVVSKIPHVYNRLV